MSTLAPRDRFVLTASDELFFALEGRTIEAAGDSWCIEVCGVHSGDSQHWVQLHLRGPVSQGLTVCIPRLDARLVITIVGEWLDGLLPTALETSVTGKTYLPVLTN